MDAYLFCPASQYSINLRSCRWDALSHGDVQTRTSWRRSLCGHFRINSYPSKYCASFVSPLCTTTTTSFTLRSTDDHVPVTTLLVLCYDCIIITTLSTKSMHRQGHCQTHSSAHHQLSVLCLFIKENTYEYAATNCNKSSTTVHRLNCTDACRGNLITAYEVYPTTGHNNRIAATASATLHTINIDTN